jgi:hypothetical protein
MMTNTQTNQQVDPLYARAKQILSGSPIMGKGKLARLLGIKTPTSRRLIERWRGETQGHSTDPNYVRVHQLKTAHPDWGAVKIAQALSLTLDHAKLHLARWIGAQAHASPLGPSVSAAPATLTTLPSSPDRDNELQDSVNNDSRDLSYCGTRIKTLEDLLVYAQVNTTVWEVERHTINKWEVAAKIPGGMATTMLYQIKAWLRRKVVEEKLTELMAHILEQFKQAAPLRTNTHRPSANPRGMLEISIMDMHLGKYCSPAETGGLAYNADVAERMFTDAVEDLLSKAGRLPIEKILFVCGNDFFNTDHLGRATTAGTPQDECLRYQESFIRGRQLLVRAIDRVRELAPTEVLMVTGNHDTQRLYYLGDSLAAWYRNTADVQVENSPRQRKYVRFHRNLIGFTHGNNEKHFDLPLLLATEDPEGWSQSRHREFHLGHFHSRKHKMFVPSFERAGVLVRLLPSLCPPDAWHAAMGYNAKLAAEALYYDPNEGCVATFTHSPN